MQFYQKTWFIVLMLFVFAPIGLFLMWKYKPNWNKHLRILLTAMAVICFVCCIIGMVSDGDTAEPTAETTTALETYSQSTEPITEEATIEATTNEITSTTADVSATVSENTSATKAQGQNISSKQPTTPKEKTTHKETTTQNPDAQHIVYITKTGKRYHYENPCGNGTYYPISLADAKARGFTPCEKCVLH